MDEFVSSVPVAASVPAVVASPLEAEGSPALAATASLGAGVVGSVVGVVPEVDSEATLVTPMGTNESPPMHKARNPATTNEIMGLAGRFPRAPVSMTSMAINAPLDAIISPMLSETVARTIGSRGWKKSITPKKKIPIREIITPKKAIEMSVVGSYAAMGTCGGFVV